MNYSDSFERDYNWYFKYRSIFTFDGKGDYYNKKGKSIIVFEEDGYSAKECFYQYDSNGSIKATNNPILLQEIIRCKGAINLQIKEWAKGRADGTLPKLDFDKIIIEYELLDWIIDAVEEQKYKYY